MTDFPVPDDFDSLAALPGEVCRAVEDRETKRCEIAGRVCYVKLQRGISLGELAKNLVTLRLPILDTGTESRALRRLAQADIPAARVLANGFRGWWPGSRRSWLVLSEVEHIGNLEDLLENEALGTRARRRLAAATGDLVRRLHKAGVNHRDLYLCHVLLDEGGELHLLDLHRAQVRSTVPRRWLAKDLAALLYSSMISGFTDRERKLFLASYCSGDNAALRGDSAFWALVHGRVVRMQQRERRHGTRDFALRRERSGFE